MSPSAIAPVGRLALPCLRARMGDWTYYSVTMRFSEIAERIQSSRQLDPEYDTRPLSRWIQRRLDHKRVAKIADYLCTEPSRFFSAIVVGVHGGKPEWYEASLSDETATWLNLGEERRGSLGVLTLAGDEQLFAIDGQHRVEGIKKLLKGDAQDGVELEEVVVSLVAHSRDEPRRTREMFMALNRLGKRPTVFDLICLSDSDPFAVAVREFVDNELVIPFRLVSMSGEALSSARSELISLVGIWRIAKELWWDSPSPAPDEARTITQCLAAFFKSLVESAPEVAAVVHGDAHAGSYRGQETNLVEVRPIFLRAMARAIGILVGPHPKRIRAFSKRLTYARQVDDPAWGDALWDEAKSKMRRGADLAEITARILEQSYDVKSVKKRMEILRREPSPKTRTALSYLGD